MAENEREITTVFKADISQFTQSTQQLNKYVATVNSEFKNATASMDRWNDNAAGLTAKITQLNGVLGAEKQKLDAIQKEYDETVKKQGSNSKAAQELYIKLNQQSAKVKDTEKQITYYSNSLKELQKAGVNTKQELEELTSAADKQGSTFKSVASTLGRGLAKGIAGVATAAAGAVTSFLSLGSSTREYRQGLAQIETAFGQLGFSAEEAYDAMNYFGSVLGDTRKAQETMLVLGQLVDSEKELESWTDTLTGVYATYGEAIPLESMSEALVLASKQAVAEGGLADALEWGGVNLEDFNAKLESLNSEEERSAYIQETLNGLYGEAAENYKELNKDVLDANTASTNLEHAMAQLGAVAEPILTMLKQAAADLLTQLQPFVKLMGEGLTGVINGTAGASEKLAEGLNGAFEFLLTKVTEILPHIVQVVADLIPKIIETILNALPQLLTVILNAATQVINLLGQIIPQILVKISELLPQLINQIVSAVPQLLQAILQVVQAIVDALPTIITNIINALPSIIDTVINAILEAIPLLLDAAIKLFNSIIDAIPIILKSLIKTLPKIINSIIDAVLNALPLLLEAAIKLLMEIVNAIPTIVKILVKELPKIITTIVSALTSRIGDIINAAIQLFMGIVEAIPQIISELIKQMPTIISSIVTGLIEGIPQLIKAGGELLAGLFKGLLSPKVIWENVKKLGKSILNSVKSFFGIKSPSKLMRDQVGKYLGEGIGLGLLSSEKDVKRDIAKFNKGILSGFNYSLNPNIKAPALANGGLVTSPTLAMVGEAGKEAIMPLENNTAWLDKIADKISAKMGTNNTTNNFNYTFEKMATTKLALHKAKLETMRIIGG